MQPEREFDLHTNKAHAHAHTLRPSVLRTSRQVVVVVVVGCRANVSNLSNLSPFHPLLPFHPLTDSQCLIDHRFRFFFFASFLLLFLCPFSLLALFFCPPPLLTLAPFLLIPSPHSHSTSTLYRKTPPPREHITKEPSHIAHTLSPSLVLSSPLPPPPSSRP
ncbi:MAG: hypothetical protein J3Q66DRAFT_161356 [Benniella sp.]|nr:MAG: hypothetical protein J3Q66DRAFT_161356 [Benniella sp.]